MSAYSVVFTLTSTVGQQLERIASHVHATNTIFERLGITADGGCKTDLKPLDNQVEQLGETAKRAEFDFKSLGATIAAVVASVGATALAGGTFAIKLAADLEQSEMAFGTLLGSTTKAKAFLADLNEFAAKTPFELPGLQAASRKLLAFGFDAQQIIPMMTSIGDAVGSLGGGADEISRVTLALGQMQAKSKVSAEEMGQLAELGIPVWQILADQIGITVPQAMDRATQGAISAGTAIPALLQGMTERFGGAMQTQANTVNGLFSTLQDTARQAATRIGQDLTKSLDVRGMLVGVTALITKLQGINAETGAISSILETIKSKVIDTFNSIVAGAVDLGKKLYAAVGGEGISSLIDKFKTFWDQLQGMFSARSSAIAGIWTGIVVPALVAIAPIVVKAVKTILDVLGSLANFAKDIFTAIAGYAKDFGNYLPALGALVLGLAANFLYMNRVAIQAFANVILFATRAAFSMGVTALNGLKLLITSLLTGTGAVGGFGAALRGLILVNPFSILLVAATALGAYVLKLYGDIASINDKISRDAAASTQQFSNKIQALRGTGKESYSLKAASLAIIQYKVDVAGAGEIDGLNKRLEELRIKTIAAEKAEKAAEITTKAHTKAMSDFADAALRGAEANTIKTQSDKDASLVTTELAKEAGKLYQALQKLEGTGVKNAVAYDLAKTALEKWTDATPAHKGD